MNWIRPALASLGLAVAVTGISALSVATSEATPTQGYSLLGHSLSTNNREFRVNNNFADAQANNNTASHYNYPGTTGAVQAIWKGHVEWNSRAHGDGAGDPLSNNFLGSGLANMDFHFNGETTSTGNFNHTHRVLAGSSGTTLAYMTGGSNWHIRYYEVHTWQDGPGNASTGYDIQAVACHEVGHALGLGHSGDGAATMWPSIGSGSEAERSINDDDRAGLQAIYGAESSTKPRIFDLSGSFNVGGTLVIEGTNFSTNDNEVWFTNIFDTQTIAKVTGVPSTLGGTRIEVVIPTNAMDGSVMVRKNATGNASLSQSKPLDLGAQTGDPPLITGVVPGEGPNAGYTEVTLTGLGFLGTTAVRFGDIEALAFTVESATQITATSPPGALNETVDITVVDDDGQHTLVNAFTYGFNLPMDIDQVSPTTGPAGGGTVVTISGPNTVPVFGATFDGEPGTGLEIVSATEFNVQTPPHAPGVVDVAANGFGSETLPGAFTYEGAGAFVDLGPGMPGALGPPILGGTGDLTPGSAGGFTLSLTGASPNTFGIWWISLSEGLNTLICGPLYPSIPFLLEIQVFTDGNGEIVVPGAMPLGSDGLSFVMQMYLDDPTGSCFVTSSNGLRIDVP